ncbi:MAG: site-2 protease family protein [Pyrinomonadaceae bacterium]|nr:site-2 protease family protein [Pyrinomonadaceae bacterium]
MSDLKDFPMQRKAMRPTFRTWLKHFFWFFLTFFTLTLTGSLGLFNTLPFDATLETYNEPQNWSETIKLILSIPQIYFSSVVYLFQLIQQNPQLLKDGLTYAACLLFILTSHEAGHYIACRIYGVDATLPYFIPSPPLIAVGTFGAFIKIVSPIPSKRAVFDIGVAGPLAGFVALIPIAFIGLYTMEAIPPEKLVETQSGLTLSDPLFTHLLGWLIGINPTYGYANPFYISAWIGFLVTALNLIPSGQLDGGHAVYAVFGENFHKWTGRIAFISMAILTVLGWYYFNSPSGLLFLIILAIMLKVGHPKPNDETPLDFKRKIVALITLIVFILSFMPFPIKIN